MKIREIDIPDTRPLIVKAAGHRPSSSANLNPPITLGRPRDTKSAEYKNVMAMDRCIKNVLSGFRNELLSCGTPLFVGYPVLANVSQEALIRAGVETIADEMTRKNIKVVYNDDTTEDCEKEINELEKELERFKIKGLLNDAAQKDGYFGGCLIYIDVGDLDDDEKLEPLVLDKKTFKKGMLKGFRVIEPINVYPAEYNTTDPTDKYYFNPEYWYILGKKYHSSRFLYIASNKVPVLLKAAYNFFGISRSQLALDYIAHFVENREAAQNLLEKFSLTCWKTNMGQVLQGDSCSELVKRVKMFNKMRNNDRTVVLDKETEDMVQINTPLSGVREIVEMSLNLLTAVWRIPKIKYIGEGEGGLNASSREQMRSFYDFIASQREKMFSEPVDKIIKILQLNMGKEINDALGFVFPPMIELDDTELATLNKTKADRDIAYINAGVLSQEEVRQSLSLDKTSGYSMIDVDNMPEPKENPLDSEEQPEEKEFVEVEDSMIVEDGKWITIGHKDPDEDGEGGRKGRHIYLDDGETPEEVINKLKKDDDKNEQTPKKDDSDKLYASAKEDKRVIGYKNVNKNIQEFIKLKKEKDNAHKFLSSKEEEFKKKLNDLREKSEEYQKADYEEHNYKEIAKEKGVFEWTVIRDAHSKKTEIDRALRESVEKSISGYLDAKKIVNDYDRDSSVWKKGIDEIQSKMKDRLVEVSKENEKLSDSLVKIENKIPEYKEKLDSLWKDYVQKSKDSDIASSMGHYAVYTVDATEVKTKLNKEKEDFAKRVGEILKDKDGQSVGFSKSSINGLEERFKAVFDGVMSKGILSDNDKPNVVGRNCRAHQSGETLTLTKTTDIQTAIHEYMHYVEEKNPQMIANSIAFLKYRTGNEKIKSLKKLTGASYGSGEKARADNFFNAYCGKIYSMTDDYSDAFATEIMSMGVQELFTNPAKFRKEDPEYFNFVIANLKGTL